MMIHHKVGIGVHPLNRLFSYLSGEVLYGVSLILNSLPCYHLHTVITENTASQFVNGEDLALAATARPEVFKQGELRVDWGIDIVVRMFYNGDGYRRFHSVPPEFDSPWCSGRGLHGLSYYKKRQKSIERMF